LNQGRDLLLDPRSRLLKHAAFTGEQDLARQMLAFVELYKQTAKPLQWTHTGKVLAA